MARRQEKEKKQKKYLISNTFLFSQYDLSAKSCAEIFYFRKDYLCYNDDILLERVVNNAKVKHQQTADYIFIGFDNITAFDLQYLYGKLFL